MEVITLPNIIPNKGTNNISLVFIFSTSFKNIIVPIMENIRLMIILYITDTSGRITIVNNIPIAAHSIVPTVDGEENLF